MFGNLNSIRLLTLGVVLLSSIPDKAHGQVQSETAAREFRWLDSKTDKDILDRIEAMIEKSSSAHVAITGALSRVGVYESTALVIEGTDEDPASPGRISYRAFTLDLDRKRAEEIVKPGPGLMWQVKFVRVARFSDKSPADVVFRFRDCIDCESTELLAAFRFSQTDSRWKFRQWDPEAKPELGSFLLIGADMETGDTEKGVSVTISTACVYKVYDLDGDGLDDVGSWCRVIETEMDPPGRQISKKDTTLLFTAKNGTGQTTEIKDPSVARDLRQKLCSGQERKPLCRSMVHIPKPLSPTQD